MSTFYGFVIFHSYRKRFFSPAPKGVRGVIDGVRNLTSHIVISAAVRNFGIFSVYVFECSE